MARKTIEELEAAARAAEERAKKLRAKAEDLPDRFRAWAQKNREKYNSGSNTYT